MTDRNEVFAFRDAGVEGYGVMFGGMVCAPTWNARGPAEAYLDALMTGTRKAEYAFRFA